MEDDIETLTITEREDVDLTDKLWNVLKKVESFAQLVEAWKFVFSTFKREEIKPYVSLLFLGNFVKSVFSSITIFRFLHEISPKWPKLFNLL